MRTLVILSFIGFIVNHFKPTDYRDTYCGTYVGKRIHGHLNEQRTAIVYDTINYSISVSKNNVDSLIDIATKEGSYTVKLIVPLFRSDVKRFSGHFSNDSIYLTHVTSLAPISFRYVATK